MSNKDYIVIDTKYNNDWALYDGDTGALKRHSYSPDAVGEWDPEFESVESWTEWEIGFIVINASGLARRLFNVV